MRYSIDLTGISLQSYQEILKKQNLLPSRRILRDDSETNFQRIADAGKLLGQLSAVNADGRYYHAKLGKKDMQFVIDFAVLLRNIEKR